MPGTPGRTLIEWATRAEERGFSSLGTIGRVAYPSYASLAALAAAGAVTERVRLMTQVLLGPTRNAVLLAKEAATVDRISRGRLVLGLGVGGRRDDFDAVGVDFSTRGRKWDRDLETIHRVWRGEVVKGTDRPIGPAPVRDGRIPVLIGGTSEQALARVVRWGIGWISGGAPVERASPFAERVRAAWRAAGREGSPRIAALAYFALGDAAKEGALRYLTDYYGAAGERMAAGVPTNAEEVRRTVAGFQAAGFDELMLDPTIASLDQVDGLADAVLAGHRT